MTHSSRYEAVKAQILRGGMAGVFYNAMPHNESLYVVTDEQHSFPTHLTSGSTINVITLDGETNIIGRTVDWTLERTDIISGTQIVTVSGTTNWVATPNIEYTTSYASGTITRLITGDIPYGAVVLVDYQWERPCIDLSTGSPNATCPQCNGDGYFYGSGTSVIGLPHIPKFESPFTRTGFWQTGDLFYTIPEEYNIDVRYYGTDQLFIRDKLVMNGEDWNIMSSPESIQLNNEVLAKKLHLRRRKEIL